MKVTYANFTIGDEINSDCLSTSAINSSFVPFSFDYSAIVLIVNKNVIYYSLIAHCYYSIFIDFPLPVNLVYCHDQLSLNRRLSWVGTFKDTEGVIIMMCSLDAHFCHNNIVNSLWPSGAIRWQRSGSTLAQVMACCLMAPSRYLNQWLLISQFLWPSYQSNFTRSADEPIL